MHLFRNKFFFQNLDCDSQSKKFCKKSFLVTLKTKYCILTEKQLFNFHLKPKHFNLDFFFSERLHSPPYLSVSPSSNGSAPDTSRISPTFSPLSRTMANSGTMRGMYSEKIIPVLKLCKDHLFLILY